MATATPQLHMLTTTDNPYNPFTHFDEWYTWDEAAGYHTTAYLARITRSSNELSELDQDLALEYAIDEILQYNITGVYTKIPQPAEMQAA